MLCCVVCGVQNRQNMKELRARETKALSEEDYELGTYVRTYIHTFPYILRWWSAAEWRPLFSMLHVLCGCESSLCLPLHISHTVAEELQGQLETVSRDSSWSISSTSHPLVGQSLHTPCNHF